MRTDARMRDTWWTVAIAVAALAGAGCGRGCRSSEPPPAPPAGAMQPSAPAGTAAGGAAAGGASATGAAPSADIAGSERGEMRRVPACRLVARREVQEILGSPIGKPIPEDAEGTTECSYPPSQVGHSNQAHVTITWNSPRTGPSLARQLADAGRGTEPGPQVAQHVALGDEADWSLDGELTVRSGPTLITVSVGMGPESRQQTEAIARKILERLGGAPLPDLANDEPTPADDTMPNLDDLLGSPKVH